MGPALEKLKKALKENPRDSRILKAMGQAHLNRGEYRAAKEKYCLSCLFDPRIISEIMLDHEHLLELDLGNIQGRLSLINFCLSSSDIQTAVLELEELLEIDPYNLTVYHALGKLYIKYEKIDEALELLEKSQKLGIKDLRISEMLAAVYLEKDRLQEAINFYEELPPDKQRLRTLGELYTRTKNYKKAAEKYAAMFSDDPEVSSEVMRKLEDLILKDIKSVKIREILALVYEKSMKPDLAVLKYNEIIKLDPSYIETVIEKLKMLLKIYPQNPEASLALARAYISKGFYSEAILEFEKITKTKPELLDKAIQGCKEVLGKFPKQFSARQFLAESYIKEGLEKEALGELKQILLISPEGADWVISKCKELVKKNPQSREVLGQAYLVKQDFSRASLEAETLLSYDKNSTAAQLLLGDIYLSQKFSRRAVETLRKALELSPYDRDIHKKYKEAREKELDLEIESVKKRLAEDEWKFSLHLDLAKLYLIKDQREDALREFQTALKDSTRTPFVYHLLGNFYREEGRFDLAMSSFRKGHESLTAENEEISKKLRYGLALSYEAMGFVKRSIKGLEELLQIDLDYPNLKDKIKFLKASSLASVQNKMLAACLKDLDKKEIFGFWGREGKSHYKKQTLSVSFGQNYNNSGLDYFFKAMYQAALEEFQLSEQLAPNFVAGLNNLGVCLMVNGRFDEALYKFRDAHELEPSSAIISNNMGLTYILMGNSKDAQTWLKRAHAIDKEQTAADINLADVYYLNDQANKAIELYKQVPVIDLLGDLAQKRLLYKVP